MTTDADMLAALQTYANKVASSAGELARARGELAYWQAAGSAEAVLLCAADCEQQILDWTQQLATDRTRYNALRAGLVAAGVQVPE